jgi:hypothetical protein
MEECPKQAPLLVPVDPADDGPEVSLVEALAVVQRNGRQKKDLFLNVRSQIEQLHDLGDPGSRHPAEARQFRIIPNRLLAQQPVKAMASAMSRAILGMEPPARSPAGGCGWDAALLFSRRPGLPARKSTAYVTSWLPLTPASPVPL